MELLSLSALGVLLIVLAWFIQTYASGVKGRVNLSLYFALFYAVGALILAYDAFQGKEMLVAIANLIVAVLAAMCSFFSVKGKK